MPPGCIKRPIEELARLAASLADQANDDNIGFNKTRQHTQQR
jgi:hypothetical protein